MASPPPIRNEPPPAKSPTDFPDGVLTDILSRLPAQSVCVCRCVCKSFLNLTNNTGFPKLHFSRSRPQFLIRYFQDSQNPSQTLDFLDPQLSVDDDDHVPIKPRFLIPKPRKQPKDSARPRYYSVVNSCNGLLCLANRFGDPRVVYNPITGEYVMIPKRKIVGLMDDGSGSGPVETGYIKCAFDSGFGYCGETNRFKVLRMTTWIGGAEIYELGTDSWRVLESVVPAALEEASGPIFLNGCLHWDCVENGIISFDCGTEKFGEVPLPTNFILTHKDNALGLTVFEDCLSVCDFIPREHFNIWVMKEYGIQESWTKQFVIDIAAFPFFTIYEFQPIGCLGGGELLMQGGRVKRLVCYDFLDKSFRFLKFVGDNLKFGVYLHTPSFTSLKDVVPAEHVGVLDDCLRSDQGEGALFLKQYDRMCVDDALLDKIAGWRAFFREEMGMGEESWDDHSNFEDDYEYDDNGGSYGDLEDDAR